MNCRNVLGCNKIELYSYIKNNLRDGMSLDNYGMWRMGHKFSFDIENNKDSLYIIKYFNYKNLIPEWYPVK
jgi:hypothetical protein